MLEGGLLGIAAFVVGIVAVLFGGSMFFSVPVLRVAYSSGSLAQMVGCIKVGSVVRGVFSTWETRSSIKTDTLISKYFMLLSGGVFGSLAITHLSESWILPVVCVAIIVALLADRIAKFIEGAPEAKHLLSFAVGIYGGFFGAGISLLLFALLRVLEPERYGEDEQIFDAKIQARFLEFILVVATITGHVMAGTVNLQNINIWLPWAVGSALGGLVGGRVMMSGKKWSPSLQRKIMWVSFFIALCTAAAYHFEWLRILDLA